MPDLYSNITHYLSAKSHHLTHTIYESWYLRSCAGFVSEKLYIQYIDKGANMLHESA